MNLLVRPAAAAEIEAAVDWYEGRRAGLGRDFLEVVNSAFDSIRSRPDAHRVVHRDTRRMLLKRFPYAIYYRLYDDAIVVVACMHGRRHPLRWKVRQ